MHDDNHQNARFRTVSFSTVAAAMALSPGDGASGKLPDAFFFSMVMVWCSVGNGVVVMQRSVAWVRCAVGWGEWHGSTSSVNI